MEDVEVEGCNDGVPEGVLLIEVAANGAGLLVEPGSPLVKEKAYAS